MKNLYDELASLPLPTRALDQTRQARILDRALKQCGQTAHRRRPLRAAIIAAAVCCLCAGGVAAAGHFLAPGQVAEQMEQQDLAALFAGPDAVEVNAARQAGGYTVTLLGLTGGENVTGYWSSDWGENAPQPERSYAVLAISHSDGSPMAALEDTDSDVTLSNSIVSPLLAAPDCALMDYNIFTMNGARHDLVADGVRYVLVETDDLQPFADKDPQLAVVLNSTAGISDLLDGYTQDAVTGAITPRDNGATVNLLFDLPLDESLADRERADQLRDQWLHPEEPDDLPQDAAQALAPFDDLTPEEVRAAGTLQHSETVAVTDGVYGPGWYYGDGGFQASTAGWEPTVEDWVAMWSDTGQVVLMTYNPDDTLTVEQWQIPVE